MCVCPYRPVLTKLDREVEISKRWSFHTLCRTGGWAEGWKILPEQVWTLRSRPVWHQTVPLVRGRAGHGLLWKSHREQLSPPSQGVLRCGEWDCYPAGKGFTRVSMSILAALPPTHSPGCFYAPPHSPKEVHVLLSHFLCVPSLCLRQFSSHPSLPFFFWLLNWSWRLSLSFFPRYMNSSSDY